MDSEDLAPEQQHKVKDSLARTRRMARRRPAAGNSKQTASLANLEPPRNAANKYKQVRNALRIAKIGTGVSGAGLPLMVLMAHGEWIFHKFNNKYPFSKLDKILTLAADGIIAAALVVLMFVAYLQTHPVEAAKIGWKLLNI